MRIGTPKITLKSLACDSLVLRRSLFYNLIFRYEDELAVSLAAVGTLKGNTAPKLLHPSPPPPQKPNRSHRFTRQLPLLQLLRPPNKYIPSNPLSTK